jgi:hypothetical protein
MLHVRWAAPSAQEVNEECKSPQDYRGVQRVINLLVVHFTPALLQALPCRML